MYIVPIFRPSVLPPYRRSPANYNNTQHFEFYYFIVNRTQGPNGLLFDYPSPLDPPNPNGEVTTQGGKEDPTMTKVVDRRWYERNKHIFPASVWTEFDPNTDYRNMVRRDQGGNAFFFG